MGKGKPRWYPEKKQNKYGDFCKFSCDTFYDENNKEIYLCEGARHGWEKGKVCQGNRHNCIKTYYKRLASRSNKQINEGLYKP